ncbi:exonuclease SbcCD subunit D C-terminal domain-containing protein [Terasakiella pusilla]|uniref:exonuclease SbcCD subunit D C-terminal domain-containing protein n=1 Tax=Terasakiella pusilla TaxID=64973 RepID=UPI003AA88AA1
MNVLHTSDWHLGRMLYGKKRYNEFAAFLDWLITTIKDQQIDCLIVAGDIFDTTTPSNRAQSLYYQFLCDMAKTQCRHVVIVAGNHDSPSFLDAPKALLKALNVHVVGQRSDHMSDDILVLRNANAQPEAILCAVPYLRDRDLRKVEAGETLKDKEQKLLTGIKQHYHEIAQTAARLRTDLKADIPLIATGHLFAAGGRLEEGDGVRDLYVGSLGHVGVDVFADLFDYVALGHLHVPQVVGGCDIVRYSGSPLPMGFGEAKQQKSVCKVTFDATTAEVQTLDIPVFQKLVKLQGDLTDLRDQLTRLVHQKESVWVELVYTGKEIAPHLRDDMEQIIEDSPVEILRLQNKQIVDRILSQSSQSESLEDLSVHDVFERCLSTEDHPEVQQDDLRHAYNEILKTLYEDDTRAE